MVDGRTYAQMVANQVARARNNRLAQEKRMNDALSREHVTRGQALVDGAGEFTLSLNFPVIYIEKPFFFCGFELYPDNEVADGAFPTGSAMVLDFDIREYTQQKIHFIGATIVGVITGSESQRTFVNYRFEGKAITNPTGGGETSDSVI